MTGTQINKLLINVMTRVKVPSSSSRRGKGDSYVRLHVDVSDTAICQSVIAVELELYSSEHSCRRRLLCQ